MTVHRDNDEERNERVAEILKRLQKETTNKKTPQEEDAEDERYQNLIRISTGDADAEVGGDE